MKFHVPSKTTSEFFGRFGDMFDIGAQTLAVTNMAFFSGDNLQDHLHISASKMSLVRNVIDTDGTLFIKVTVHPR